jgi:DNA-nicking Smr family endonuclease
MTAQSTPFNIRFSFAFAARMRYTLDQAPDCRGHPQPLILLHGERVYNFTMERRPPMAKLKLDLHEFYNKGDRIEAELNRIIHEAVEKKIGLVEIIPGKGSGQLKKKVIKFLERGEIKQLYHRVEKDSKNFGRLFVHFRF